MTNISAFNRGTLALAVCLVGSTFSCSADSTTSPPDVLGSRVIEQLTPVSIRGRAGSTVELAPTIRLKDKRTGNPVANAKVQFIAGPGAGSVDNPVTTTDASGVATAGKWLLGTRSVKASLVVYIEGIVTSFTADIEPDVPTHIRSISQNIVGIAGEMVDALVVGVYDRFDNPTPGVTVTFAISAGDGTLYSSSGVTDLFGGTTTGRWRLGSTPGENTVVASAAGTEPERFSVQGLDPAGIARFTLDSVRQGTRTVSPDQTGVSDSKLIITPFDQCLCRAGSGYYIVEVAYSNAATPEPTRIAGQYRIDPPQILPITGGQITSLAIVNGRLEIQIQRDDWDWMWTETWIYHAD